MKYIRKTILIVKFNYVKFDILLVDLYSNIFKSKIKVYKNSFQEIIKQIKDATDDNNNYRVTIYNRTSCKNYLDKNTDIDSTHVIVFCYLFMQ